MRITGLPAHSALLLSLLITLTACSGIEIQSSDVAPFAQGNYHYYKWRTEPLPRNTGSNDIYYALDPVMRRNLDAVLQAKGYRLDNERAQFSVDYVYAVSLREGAESSQASNISPVPSVTPNRQVDQASVDNAIALAGVKETNNILLQFNDVTANVEVWRALMTKIIENANQATTEQLDENIGEVLQRALKPLPDAS